MGTIILLVTLVDTATRLMLPVHRKEPVANTTGAATTSVAAAAFSPVIVDHAHKKRRQLRVVDAQSLL